MIDSIIKPTVGRKVWYRPSKTDLQGPIPMAVCGSVQAGTAEPLDATVVAVWGDRCVNILVLDSQAKPFPKTSVTLLQPGDEPPKDGEGNVVGGYVEWMPFQTAKPAK